MIKIKIINFLLIIYISNLCYSQLLLLILLLLLLLNFLFKIFFQIKISVWKQFFGLHVLIDLL
jgi:hypothetical protein